MGDLSARWPSVPFAASCLGGLAAGVRLGCVTQPSVMHRTVGTVVYGLLLGIAPLAHAGQSAAARPPSGLVVSQASRSAVALTWTAGDTGKTFLVERRLLGAAWPAPGATPSATIATVDATSATDRKIDQFATYVYRVRGQGAGGALSAPSNEVTVGPPPTGFSLVTPTPKAMQAHDPSQFASVISLALDDNGDPALAYLVNDLDNDGELDDSVLEFVSWNRARYRWNAPVRVATVGNVARSGTRPSLSLAMEGQQAALAYLVRDRAAPRWMPCRRPGARA